MTIYLAKKKQTHPQNPKEEKQPSLFVDELFI